MSGTQGIFTPTNWYWSVAASTTDVWSSASLSYVPLTDPTYVAWAATGLKPTRMDTPENLGDVMANQVLPALFNNGVSIASTATAALNAVYAIDPASQANITALSTGIAAGKPLPGGAATFNYADATGTYHAFTSANFLDFALAMENYLYNVEQVLAARLGGATTAMPSSTLTIA